MSLYTHLNSERGDHKMNEIVKILMDRDDLSKSEAANLFFDAQADLNSRLVDGEDCYDICQEYFGLEPDYLMDLIPVVTLTK